MAMGRSNGRYLTVYKAPSAPGTGFEVRVLDPTDMATEIAVVPGYSSLTFGPQLNDPGAGSITLSQDDPFWRTLLPYPLPNGENTARGLLSYDCLWRVYDNGELRFEFLGRDLDYQQDDAENKTLQISGPGGAQVLTYGKIMPPGFPAPPPPLDPNNPNVDASVSGSNTVAARTWMFPFRWPAMQMWWEVFKASQSRGTIPWVKPTFTATADSAGQPWVYVPTIETVSKVSGYRPEIGTNLLDFLNQCTGQDYSVYFAMRAEWQMRPGMYLDARKRIGVNRSGKPISGFDAAKTVRLYDTSVTSIDHTRNRDTIANYVAARDVNGDFSLVTDAKSVRTWSQRELLDTGHANIIEPPRRHDLASTILQQNNDEIIEWTIQIPYGDPGREPFKDFHVGDWVSVEHYTEDGTNYTIAYRVLAIVVTDADDTTTVELTLITQDMFNQSQLTAKLTDLVNRVNTNSKTDPTNPTQLPTVPDTGSSVLTATDGTLGWDSSFGGAGGGVQVFIQSTDPGAAANVGDFWYDISGAPEYAPYIPVNSEPDPADTAGANVDQIDSIAARYGGHPTKFVYAD
jgi:hypothetical protein